MKKVRPKNRYEDASWLSGAFLVQRKTDKSSLDKLPAQEKVDKTIVLRSQCCSCNKNFYIICRQKRGGRLHDVEFIANSQRTLHVAEKDLLMKHGMLEEDLHKSYKKYLKSIIEEISKFHVTFQKLPRANEPDRLCSNEAENHALDVEADAFSDIVRVAKHIWA